MSAKGYPELQPRAHRDPLRRISKISAQLTPRTTQPNGMVTFARSRRKYWQEMVKWDFINFYSYGGRFMSRLSEIAICSKYQSGTTYFASDRMRRPCSRGEIWKSAPPRRFPGQKCLNGSLLQIAPLLPIIGNQV